MSNSPPLPSWLDGAEAEMTPFGPFDKHASRKTLYLLIGTLNIAFPDHEFSEVRPQHFCREESGASVLNALSNTLIAPQRAGVRVSRTYSSYPPTSNDLFPSSVPTSSSPLNNMKPSPFAPPAIVAGTHPSLYRLVDEVIGLSDCEVFSYTPNIESDPHAIDFSDDEDDGSPLADDDSSSDDDATFEFDDYDVDELDKPSSSLGKYRPGIGLNPRIPTSARARANKDSFDDEYVIPYSVTNRRRGALLWSSHWFFLNRKLNRILFITAFARTKAMSSSWADLASDGILSRSFDKYSAKERFLGWSGGVGAGARALGLTA